MNFKSNMSTFYDVVYIDDDRSDVISSSRDFYVSKSITLKHGDFSEPYGKVVREELEFISISQFDRLSKMLESPDYHGYQDGSLIDTSKFVLRIEGDDTCVSDYECHGNVCTSYICDYVWSVERETFNEFIHQMTEYINEEKELGGECYLVNSFKVYIGDNSVEMKLSMICDSSYSLVV